MFTTINSCMFTHLTAVYLCLLLFTYVYHCLLEFTYVYSFYLCLLVNIYLC